jgi:hypothetical protein
MARNEKCIFNARREPGFSLSIFATITISEYDSEIKISNRKRVS